VFDRQIGAFGQVDVSSFGAQFVWRTSGSDLEARRCYHLL